MISKLVLLFGGVFIVGALLTRLMLKLNLQLIPLKGVGKKFGATVPLAAAFLLIIFASVGIKLIAFLLITAMILIEFVSVFKTRRNRMISVYAVLFMAAWAHLGLLADTSGQDILLVVVIGSVMSDTCAFFFGGFFGRHKLAAKFNGYKSWEGVVGQIVGALVGVILVNAIIAPQQNSLWLFLPIGLGSAAGDLLNSRIKRAVGIKDWSEFIPGHGGFVDRLASLAAAALLTYYVLLLWA